MGSSCTRLMLAPYSPTTQSMASCSGNSTWKIMRSSWSPTRIITLPYLWPPRKAMPFFIGPFMITGSWSLSRGTRTRTYSIRQNYQFDIVAQQRHFYYHQPGQHIKDMELELWLQGLHVHLERWIAKLRGLPNCKLRPHWTCICCSLELNVTIETLRSDLPIQLRKMRRRTIQRLEVGQVQWDKNHEIQQLRGPAAHSHIG